MRITLGVLLAACLPIVLPENIDMPPACAVDGTIADTAPGFSLPTGHARIFVVSNPAADPAQQKLDAELLSVVREQGGTVVDDPLTADLVVSAAAEDFTVDREAVEYVTASAHSFGSFSLVGRHGGWGLSESTTIVRFPIVMTKHARVTKLHIDAFQPKAADRSKLRQVWSAELQAGEARFRDTPHACVNALFRRIGGPDGIQ